MACKYNIKGSKPYAKMMNNLDCIKDEAFKKKWCLV